VPYVRALLCDRDGTLIEDVPYNGDPARIMPLDGVAAALDRARQRGLKIGVVTNQSGVAKGLFDHTDLEAMHARLETLLGPFDVICTCPHDEDAGCSCRKPAPGLILQAAAHLGVPAPRCAVLGDTFADVEAARRAGAVGVLVPNEHTRPEEISGAELVARSFGEAVGRLVP
jgi:D-glycero-D-manno-heptose 1,7-bisphosphate phosphatase